MGCSPFLNQVEAQLNRQRFCTDVLTEIRGKVARLRKLSRAVPEKRPLICMLTDELTRMASEVLDMMNKEAYKNG